MDKVQALQVLINASQRCLASAQDHVLFQQAAQVLADTIKEPIQQPQKATA